MDRLILFTLIAEFSLGEKILNIASWHEVIFSEFLLAKSCVGSVTDREKGKSDSKCHLINIVCTEKVKNGILDDLKEELYYAREDSILTFTRPISKVIDSKSIFSNKGEEDLEKAEGLMAVYVIVEKGYSEDVILLSSQVGAKGATVIPAMGNKFAARFVAPGLNVNPHKEIIMIITTAEKAEELFKLLKESEDILGPGKGIAFTQEITESLGIIT